MPPNFMPLGFASELVYTIVVLVFCLLVYLKTREIYALTKHKGIQFFRYAFLFFGLAYASRLFLYITAVSNVFFSEPRRFMPLMPVSNLVMAYFSTMAILYLTYSTIWKKFSMEHFLTFSNIIAIIIAVIGFVSRSPLIVSFTQLILLVITIGVSVRSYDRTKRKTHTRALYFLVAIFWLISLFILDVPFRILPFSFKIPLQIISIIVFILIYHKLTKWIK